MRARWSLYNPIMWWYAVGFYSALFIPLLLLTFPWRMLRLFQRSEYTVSIADLASIRYGYLLATLTYKSALLGPDYVEHCRIRGLI
jgi:hypothetical protein